MLKKLLSLARNGRPPEKPAPPPLEFRWMFTRSAADAENRYHRHCCIGKIKPKNGLSERALYELS